jgi:anti-anti-sigma regulatory factor
MVCSSITGAGPGFGQHDHWCWAYDQPGEFRAAVGEFLAEGLAQGLRVCYLAEGDKASLRDDLRDLDQTTRDAVQVLSLGDWYPTGTLVEPAAQVRAFTTAMDEALAAGFAGLRVAAEVTPLVRTPEQLDTVARYEYLVDRHMVNRPLSGLCGYNRAELGEETLAQLACLHPAGNVGAPLFRLHASPWAAAALSGELDASSLDLLRRALRWADLRPTAGEVVIDASELSFIDHRSLRALGDYARGWDATVVLLGELPGAAKMIDILDLDNVRVEGST